MAESFSIKLEEARVNGHLPGLRITKNLKDINHSSFAYDTLLLGGASKIILTKFKEVLDCYLRPSRGLVNKKRSLILGWNSFQITLEEISLILSFNLAKNWRSFPYLGLPISLGPTYSEDWDGVFQKFHKRIHS